MDSQRSFLRADRPDKPCTESAEFGRDRGVGEGRLVHSDAFFCRFPPVAALARISTTCRHRFSAGPARDVSVLAAGTAQAPAVSGIDQQPVSAAGGARTMIDARASGAEPKIMPEARDARQSSGELAAGLTRLCGSEMRRTGVAGRAVGGDLPGPVFGFTAADARLGPGAPATDRLRVRSWKPGDLAALRAEATLEDPCVTGTAEASAAVDAMDRGGVAAALITGGGRRVAHTSAAILRVSLAQAASTVRRDFGRTVAVF